MPRVEAPPTGFGGYRWQGKVNEIEAEWRVPRIVSTASEGAESTWIGVQGPGTDEPFIQLGTVAGVYDSPFLGSGGATTADSPSPSEVRQTDYQVFWSDTAQGFHAVPIVGLKHPGDLILFKMSRESDGWQLSVKNLTYGWSRSEAVRYGQEDSFTDGEWVQEDPASSATSGVDVPYADTSPVSFQQVRINGTIPQFRYADKGALSTQDGVYLIPSPFVWDAFSLMPPTGAALQYLSDAETVDASITRLGALIDWSGSHGVSAAGVSSIEQMAVLYRESAGQVATQTWPASARPAVSRFVTSHQKLAKGLSVWVDGNQHSLQQLRATFSDAPARGTADSLRKVLGLPPV